MLANRLDAGGMVRELFSPSILPNKTVGQSPQNAKIIYAIVTIMTGIYGSNRDLFKF